MKLYDNLDDAKAKLDGTYAYYDGKAVFIHQVTILEDDKYHCQLKFFEKKPAGYVDINDPKLNYTQYNLGYINGGFAAVWWRRHPVKQYKQGLRRDQLSYSISSPIYGDYSEFGLTNPTGKMLENVYPPMEKCEQLLKDSLVHASAFHKDFAFTYDKLHKDLILEYRGVKIGISQKLHDFQLAEEYTYLTEALKEAAH